MHLKGDVVGSGISELVALVDVAHGRREIFVPGVDLNLLQCRTAFYGERAARVPERMRSYGSTWPGRLRPE